MDPPRRREAVWNWLGLLLCLTIASPAVLFELGQHEVLTPGCAESVLMARELAESFAPTWKVAGAGLEPLVPLLDGREALAQPPGTAWVFALTHAAIGWGEIDTGGGVDADSTRSWVMAARWSSAIAAMVLIASVYWAGMAVGGVKPALFSALIAAGNPLLAWEVRVADGSVIAAMWVALAVGASLWATRPLRPVAALPRQAIGWGVAGAALGMAVLTLGPSAWLAVVLPVLAVLIACPHRLSHGLGLLAAVLAAVLVVLPWIALVQEREPAMMNVWLSELNLAHVWVQPTRVFEQAAWRTVGLALIFLPWLVWLVSAVLQPFSVSSQGVRQRMMLGWVWMFLSWFYVMLLPSNDTWLTQAMLSGGSVADGAAAGLSRGFASGWHAWTRGVWSGAGSELLLVLPGAAVLVGQLFRRLTELAQDGRPARVWRWLRWPHAGLILAMSLCAAVWVLGGGQALSLDFGWGDVLQGVPLWVRALWVVALLLSAAVGFRLAWQHLPGRASVLWSVWVVVVLTGLLAGVGQRDVGRDDTFYAAQQIAARVGPDDWLVQLHRSTWAASSAYDTVTQMRWRSAGATVDPRVRLHLGRVMPVLQPREITAMASRLGEQPGQSLWVLAPSAMSAYLPEGERITISSPREVVLLRVAPPSGQADR